MLTRLGFLVPFTYFWSTRLRHGRIGFHALFEWLAAAVLVVALTPEAPLAGLRGAMLAYVAFISIYEIGYLANDLYAAAKEESGGRLRGPQGIATPWVGLWVAARLIAFGLVTAALDRLGDGMWWAFFGALAVTFAFHNLLSDKELKAGSFLWLSWFRFMAPVAFAVPVAYIPGVAFACGMSYSAFRQFGYLDSKGLLTMPGRKRVMFRWSFFMWPLLATGVLSFVDEARGYLILTAYYAVVASIGAGYVALRSRRGEEVS